MTGYKNVVWTDELGQTIRFDNRRFFIEEIDMTGTPGIHTVESLAGADGQQTVRHQLGAKTIPCSFAVKDVEDDAYLQRYIAQLFVPKRPGTLKVYTREETYAIDCYPLNAPVFKRDQGVPYVWRFSVDFVADYPYWRRGAEPVTRLYSSLPGSGSSRTLTSRCPFDIPPDIYIPASSGAVLVQLYLRGAPSQGFRLLARSFPVLVRCKDFKVLNADTGEDCSQYLDVTAELDSIRIRYGVNNVVISPDNGASLSYYELSMGEV